MIRYGNDRLMELAKNILFGMEIVDKRVENRPKNIKQELNEEERKQAMLEQEMFFSDKRMQEKLDRLKFLIKDETNQNKFKEAYGDDMNCTPQSVFESMNAKTKYF